MINLIPYYSLNENESKQKWYHGTDHEFDVFKNINGEGPSQVGIWSTADKSLAELFGSNVYEVSVSYNNAYKLTIEKWNTLRTEHARDTVWFANWKKQLISKGYDAVFVKKDASYYSPDMVAVFDASQIHKI